LYTDNKQDVSTQIVKSVKDKSCYKSYWQEGYKFNIKFDLSDVNKDSRYITKSNLNLTVN